MNKGIKEIIRLNCNEEIEVKYFAKDDSIVDTTMDYSQLLDYITNLQEENERLNEKLKRNQELLQNNTLNIIKNYKSRIEKTIEYIHNHQLVFELSSKKQIQYWFDMFYKDLLNILNGGE